MKDISPVTFRRLVSGAFRNPTIERFRFETGHWSPVNWVEACKEQYLGYDAPLLILRFNGQFLTLDQARALTAHPLFGNTVTPPWLAKPPWRRPLPK